MNLKGLSVPHELMHDVKAYYIALRVEKEHAQNRLKWATEEIRRLEGKYKIKKEGLC